MSKNWQVIGKIPEIFFTITTIFLKFFVQKNFLKNSRLGMFLAIFLFFGHFSLDVLIKYVLNKKKVYSISMFFLEGIFFIVIEIKYGAGVKRMWIFARLHVILHCVYPFVRSSLCCQGNVFNSTEVAYVFEILSFK